MMNANELVAKLNGRTAEEQAKIIAAYVADKKRKQTVDDIRRDVRGKCFKDAKKLTKAQQESLIYEFLADNHAYFNGQWLRKKHGELFADNQ